ncbi:MAG: DUF1501 domain-containing protein, partial [Anaerolineae bacterium]
MSASCDFPFRMAFAPPHTAPRGDVLVVVFLRGAADVLNMVVPHGEEQYYALRPSLAIPRPDDWRAAPAERTLDLDGFFGLHPAMRPLLDAWQEQHLAFIHACGAPDESRSHFKAMALMERGITTEQGPASGWIGRHLATLDTGNPSPLRAVGLGEIPPRSLRGSIPVSALRSIVDFHLGGDWRAVRRMQAVLEQVYAGEGALQALGRETLDIMRTVQRLNPEKYRPQAGARYPDSVFGRALQQVAMLIKAEVGLEVAALDLDGWDTHFAQGSVSGQMPRLLTDLAAGLAAFYADLRDHWAHLTLVTMSEFGRRAAENGSLGTDHGHGSMMIALSGNVRGGQVHG